MPPALEETMFGMPPRQQSPTNFDGWLPSYEEGGDDYGYVEAKQRRVGERNAEDDNVMLMDAGELEDVDAEGEDGDDVDAEGESVESEEM
jgi:hypothetical protein